MDTKDLGFVLMHEHIFSGVQQTMIMNWPHTFNLEKEVGEIVDEFRELKIAGVDSIVDLTTVDLNRDAAMLKAVALRTEINIIVATGVHMNPPGYFRRPTPEPIVDLYVRDITVGIADTGVRAGILKIATEEVNDEKELQLRAVAMAHRQTGVPISTHTNAFKKVGLDQQRVFKAEGVDLSRVIIGHSGDSTDLEYLSELMEAGSTIGMDRFGARIPATTHEERCDTVAELCRRGFADRMVLSHDAWSFSFRNSRQTMKERLPEFNFFHVPLRVLPALRERGVTDEQINAMTTGNPRRLFEAQGAY